MAKEYATGSAAALHAIAEHKCSKYGAHTMIKLTKGVLPLLFTAIPFFVIPISQAGTLGGSTSYTGAWGWTFSYENIQFTRANITLNDGTIIAAPTFDITEGPDCIPGATQCTGSALFKGILKVTHGPEAGEAWAEFQMKWPEVSIYITPQEVDATDSDGETYTFLKESRVYKVELNYPPDTNEAKLSDGFKRVVPDLPRSGVYSACDGSESSLDNHLCNQEIGYGTVAFNPNDIFQPINTASGLTIGADTGFYWDEACVAFLPQNLNILVDGQDFNLKEDNDGYFRSCEGRSVAFNACTKNPYTTVLDENGEKVFNCNDKNPNDEYFTFILADAASGDRLEPAPTTTCIGTEVSDWLKLASYSGSDEKLVITPCDPAQGYMKLPYTFSDSYIAFTTSEGDGAEIKDLQIVSISSTLGTALILEESPDKTDSVWDFSNLLFRNVTYIASLELDDTVTGTAASDVLLGGNGNDSLFGFEGDDCIDGEQNDDYLWGDGHANDATAGSRGADVFVLNAKLGKDTINDFSVEDGDMIVNTSGASADVQCSGSTCTVYLKGQNFVTVHLKDGTLTKGVNVIDSAGHIGLAQCKGHPLYVPQP